MAEYDSFHYLMHKVDDDVAPTFVGAKMASFDELYSPRGNESSSLFRLTWSIEEHYWRTRSRVRFKCYEMRSKKIMILTCVNTETNEDYRTIVLKLDLLYKIIEDKAAGRSENEVLKFKKDKKLKTDEELDNAVKEYVKARLQMKKQPQPWPTFASINTVESIESGDESMKKKSITEGTESSSNIEVITTPELVGVTTAVAATVDGVTVTDTDTEYKEMMITFEKLHEDTIDIEIAPPTELDIWCTGLEIAGELKLSPKSTTTTTDEVVTTVEGEGAGAGAGEGAGELTNTAIATNPNPNDTTEESTPIVAEDGSVSPAAGNANNAAKMLKQQQQSPSITIKTSTAKTKTDTNAKGKTKGKK